MEYERFYGDVLQVPGDRVWVLRALVCCTRFYGDVLQVPGDRVWVRRALVCCLSYSVHGALQDAYHSDSAIPERQAHYRSQVSVLCLCDWARSLRAPVAWLGCRKLAAGLQASGFRLQVGSCACAFNDTA